MKLITICGFPRSGSSYLHDILIQSDQINKPIIKETSYLKETNFSANFFLSNFYENFDLDNFFIESTPDNIINQNFRSNLQYFEEVYAVIIARKTTERFYSHVKWQSIRNSLTELSYENLKLETNIIKCCDIEGNVEHLRKQLPDQNIIIIDFEALKKSPDFVLKKLCSIIGIELQNFTTPSKNQEIISVKKNAYKLRLQLSAMFRRIVGKHYITPRYLRASILWLDNKIAKRGESPVIKVNYIDKILKAEIKNEIFIDYIKDKVSYITLI